MKNLSLILNVVLLLAVAYLFVDRFSNKEEEPKVEETVEMAKPLNIMHLNIDTLQAKSAAFQAKKAELEEQGTAAEARLRNKMKAFEREVQAFAQKVQAGTMTPKAAQEEETRLARKEQNLVSEQEKLAKAFMADTDAFNLSFNIDVREILDSLKAANGYDYILISGVGSPVLTADESRDITETVLGILNNNEQAKVGEAEESQE